MPDGQSVHGFRKEAGGGGGGDGLMGRKRPVAPAAGPRGGAAGLVRGGADFPGGGRTWGPLTRRARGDAPGRAPHLTPKAPPRWPGGDPGPPTLRKRQNGTFLGRSAAGRSEIPHDQGCP